MSADEPPNDNDKHGTSIDEASPVHGRGSKIHQFQSASILDQTIRGIFTQDGPETYRRAGVLVTVEVGSIRIGTINATNAHATHPIGRLNRPKFHGPGRKRFPTKNTRMKIGMVKATKAATAPMEKRAPAGTGPAKMRRVRAMPMALLNHTALTGVLV